MKKLNLLILVGAAAALTTLNLSASDALLAPRAKDNQAKTVKASDAAPSTVGSPVYVAGTPRATEQQIKKSPGAVDSQAMSCSRNMTTSPKAAGECSSHPGAAMSCCSVANAK